VDKHLTALAKRMATCIIKLISLIESQYQNLLDIPLKFYNFGHQ